MALVILLDQFPRNLFRGQARAFAGDARALALAKRAVAAGLDEAMPRAHRLFLYMPFEHSEDLADQETCIERMTALGSAGYLDYARRHRDIIARFGRFPHRNAALGRDSTAEEIAFLKEPGSSF